jgi:anti-sigma regulatory factor (Ser/Thr protein kinase)
MITPMLELAPEPRSVRTARVWVLHELAAIGREDLHDAAELGVSELVTNAILHAEPPIVIRVGGTPTHPRVEVHDTSPLPPTIRNMNQEDRMLATIGRGLGIVAMYSTTWGAEISSQGKVVWFEPAAEPTFAEDVSVTGDVFDLSEVVDQRLASLQAPVDRVTVRLIGMPVQVFAYYRLWYEELRRELRLLALNHGNDYPLAQELSELTVQVEAERRQAVGVDRLNAAMAAGKDRVDLEYDVARSSRTTMTRLLELLEEADEFCREQRLLTLEPTRQQIELRRWYLGEFGRQAEGEEPRPWSGSYTIEKPDR